MIERELKKKRLEAAWCWQIASSFSETSAVLGKIYEAMRKFSGEPIKKETNITLDDFARKCDKLIFVDDASVRVMTLLAMSVAHYKNKQIGFISSLYGCQDEGVLLHWPDGREIGSQKMEGVVHRYLLHALSIRESDFFGELERLSKHWLGCLDNYGPKGIYRKEFREMTEWVMINDMPKIIKRRLSNKELREKLEAGFKETLEMARQDLSNCVYKLGLTDYQEMRKLEVSRDLYKVIEYAFCFEKDLTQAVRVLSFLDWMTGIGAFPKRWLYIMTQGVADRDDISSKFKKLLIYG